MKNLAIRPGSKTNRYAALIVLALLGTSVVGCAATFSSVGAMATDPTKVWAVNEPAPLTVVIHRQSAASVTASHVDRLLARTPTTADSEWLGRLPLSEEEIRNAQQAVVTHPYYAGKGDLRILPASIWADALPKIAVGPISQEAPVSETVSLEAPTPAVETAAGTAPSIGAEPAADASIDPTEASSPSPVSAEQQATVSVDESAPLASAEPRTELAMTEMTPSEGEPNPAAATPLAPKPPTAEPSPSLLAALSGELAATYAEVDARLAEIAALQTQLDEHEAALDADGLSEADEKAHEASIEKLEQQIEAAVDGIEPAQEAAAERAKALAAKVPSERRERFGTTLVNLREAVEAAVDANDAASLRYPLAAGSTATSGLGGLQTELVEAAKGNASDYFYEKTGSRPLIAGMEVQLTLNDGDVGVTLNGIPPEQVGAIEMGELISETVSRTQAFAGKTVSFQSDADNTGRILEYQAAFLDAILEGFENSGWDRPSAARVSEPGAQLRASATLSAQGTAKADTAATPKKKSLFGL